MRMTDTTLRVAAVLAAAPNEHHWGYRLGKDAGVRSGALYPILRRMLEAKPAWLTAGWEDPNDTDGRPPRRYYEVTEDGVREMGALLRRAQLEDRLPAMAERFGWARS